MPVLKSVFSTDFGDAAKRASVNRYIDIAGSARMFHLARTHMKEYCEPADDTVFNSSMLDHGVQAPDYVDELADMCRTRRT
jgi:hypothetical protein